MSKKVVMNLDDPSYRCLFPDDWDVSVVSSLEDLDDADLLLLVGHSTDVDPALYAQQVWQKCGPIDRKADLLAHNLLREAYSTDCAVIGICKGAQQTCVFYDGTLVQHVPRVGDHEIEDICGLLTEVRADHHQVMQPDSESYIFAYNYDTGYPEVVKFDDGVWGIQFHPEWSDPTSPAFTLWKDILDKAVRCEVE